MIWPTKLLEALLLCNKLTGTSVWPSIGLKLIRLTKDMGKIKLAQDQSVLIRSTCLFSIFCGTFVTKRLLNLHKRDPQRNGRHGLVRKIAVADMREKSFWLFTLTLKFSHKIVHCSWSPMDGKRFLNGISKPPKKLYVDNSHKVQPAIQASLRENPETFMSRIYL